MKPLEVTMKSLEGSVFSGNADLAFPLNDLLSLRLFVLISWILFLTAGPADGHETPLYIV